MQSEMAVTQVVVQAITQSAIKATRPGVKSMTEAADLVEVSTRRNVKGSGPKAGGPYMYEDLQ